MITKEQAKKLHYGQIVWDTSYRNADGTAGRWRVTGMTKVWKTQPRRFRTPVKHGLYEHWEITPETADRFALKEPMYKKLRKVS
jgi:hypothetical protein